MMKVRLFGLVYLTAYAMAAMAQIPVGDEFQINTYTTGSQMGARVAIGSSGEFVVVWTTGYLGFDGPDGSSGSVWGQRYDPAGTPLNGEFLVNTHTPDYQGDPQVAIDASGAFVVVWSSQQDGSEDGVFGQRFASDGSRLGAEFQINTFTTGFQLAPALANDAAGNFVVVWNSGSYSGSAEDGSLFSVQGQRFDSTGTRVGGQFQVNTFTTGRQSYSAVSMDESGRFVVVWKSDYGADGSYDSIQGQRFDSQGERLGGEFQINTYTGGFRRSRLAVATTADDGFVVVWAGASPDGSLSNVRAQRYDVEGDRQGFEFQVNSHTTGRQDDPVVATFENGNFVVVWRSDGSDGSRTGIAGHLFDAAANPLGGEFQINSYTTGLQVSPAVVSDPGGNFVVVWSSFDQDGSGQSVHGQRFCPDEDGDGACDSCVNSREALCLDGGRFQVDINWRDFNGITGSAIVVPVRSKDSGLFYFFSPNNWEILVKVLDGCAVNNHFWTFAAATTNVEYSLTVTDTKSDTVVEYFNPLGVASPAITDTGAFATCP